jgi:hypothetical protein
LDTSRDGPLGLLAGIRSPTKESRGHHKGAAKISYVGATILAMVSDSLMLPDGMSVSRISATELPGKKQGLGILLAI